MVEPDFDFSWGQQAFFGGIHNTFFWNVITQRIKISFKIWEGGFSIGGNSASTGLSEGKKCPQHWPSVISPRLGRVWNRKCYINGGPSENHVCTVTCWLQNGWGNWHPNNTWGRRDTGEEALAACASVISATLSWFFYTPLVCFVSEKIFVAGIPSEIIVLKCLTPAWQWSQLELNCFTTGSKSILALSRSWSSFPVSGSKQEPFRFEGFACARAKHPFYSSTLFK